MKLNNLNIISNLFTCRNNGGGGGWAGGILDKEVFLLNNAIVLLSLTNILVKQCYSTAITYKYSIKTMI